MSDKYNPNSVLVLGALLLVHTIGPQTVIVLPALTQGYVEYRGLSDSLAGAAASIEVWGLSVAALLMMYFISRVGWRTLMFSALCLITASNGLSVFEWGDTLLYLLRFTSGFGGGVVVAVSYAMLGQTERAQRNFGLAIMLVLIYGVIAFPLLSFLYKTWGLEGGFAFFGAFAALGLPFVRFLPNHGSEFESDDVRVVSEKRVEAVLSSVMMLVYFSGVMAAWSYFYRFGISNGLDEDAVGKALSMSQFAGMAGALVVVLFEKRLRAGIGAQIAIYITALSVGFVPQTDSFAAFLLLSCLFNFVWNLTHPLLLALLAQFDASGRIIAYGTAMQFLGIALGPSVAAASVGFIGLEGVAYASAVALAFSAVSVWGVVRFYQQRHPNKEIM